MIEPSEFNPGKLGFGLMRLPRKGLGIDIEQTSRMVDLFMEAGLTYFDTAFIYPGSEAAIKKALIDRYPRESFTLATKLLVTGVPTASLAKKEFSTSLSRRGEPAILTIISCIRSTGKTIKSMKNSGSGTSSVSRKRTVRSATTGFHFTTDRNFSTRS